MNSAAIEPLQANENATIKQYPLVDVLRGFAALWVLFYHVLALRNWDGFPTAGLAALPRVGWAGVDFFFVISGFVIGKTVLESQARTTTGDNWRWDYLDRRFRRIMPLFVATTALYVVFFMPTLIWQGWNGAVHIGSHLLFIHNVWHETHGSINGPSWSVALEMQFYLLMALAAPWIARQALWRVVAAGMVIGLGWRFASTLVLPPGASSPIIQFIYASQLPGTLDEFVCGIALAKLLQAGALDYSAKRLALWALAAVAVLGVAWQIVPPESAYWQTPWAVIAWRTLASIGFAALVACAVLMSPHTTRLSKPLRYLGTISYGIYLWHMPVLQVLIEKTPFQGVQLLSATVVATLILAALSWHGFEKLWLRRLN